MAKEAQPFRFAVRPRVAFACEKTTALAEMVFAPKSRRALCGVNPSIS